MSAAPALAPAVAALRAADALVITAGAGMGVDSGLPDFRGNEGFWRAYPPFERMGLSFMELANPRWFERDPALAWGFYGHRLNLYRATAPHAGFALLRRWAATKPGGAFVFTSNVDGQFQRAGFAASHIVEFHGSLHHLQCTAGCPDVWDAEDIVVRVPEQTMRAEEPLPHCHHCGALARPNVLMFGDAAWLADRTEAQEQGLTAWLLERRGLRIAIVELGAGRSVPTVRHFSEQLSARLGAPLVRINPREAAGPRGTISLSGGALGVLQQLDEAGVAQPAN
jgi:NAD-dependent SIR2 family protein deacetylase